ncbi:MAG: response regulator [Alphaproteobacteria bacterium]|nr:response regulator [Alphaproteobacteria bacterium]
MKIEGVCKMILGVQETQGPLTVLLVEDDAHDRELYKRALSRHFSDITIRESETAGKGLASLRESGVDCVLLDNNLPDGNGVDFLSALRREMLVPDAAVIMITGMGDERTAVRAMKLGAMKLGAGDYLVKERGMEEIVVKSVAQAVERTRHQREIASFRDRLEASHRAMSEFAHTAAHDLKSPLRRVLTYCDMLAEKAAGHMTAEEKGYIERIGVNARRMRQLVDDLLVFSSAEYVQEERAPHDIVVLIEEALENLDEMMRQSEATVEVGAMPRVSVYPVRIRQMFQNLVSNAIKYRKRDAPLQIEISCTPAADGTHTFMVRDNGIGIDGKHLDGIFKAFERLHRHDDIEGSGLGLAICKKVAEMHGGRIWAESEPGAGAAFYFTVKE